MDTSSTTSWPSPPLPSRDSIRSTQVPSRVDVASTPGQAPLVTTVQISPVRAPPEITCAIRRQKLAAGVVYPSVSEPPRHEFKVFLSGDFRLDSTRFIVTPSHCLSRGPADWGSSHPQHYTHVSSNHRASGRSRSFHDGSSQHFLPGTASQMRSVTWSPGGDAYNRPRVESDHAHPNSGNTWSRYQNVRYHWPLQVLGKSAKSDATRSSSLGENLPEVCDTSSSFPSGVIATVRKQDHLDSQAVPAPALPPAAGPEYGIDSSVVDWSLRARSKNMQARSSSGALQARSSSGALQARSSSGALQPRSSFGALQAQTQKALEVPGALQAQTQKAGQVPGLQSVEAMPGLQLADAILGSVGWNLDRLYKLCQTTFRYYEYFEPLNPRMFLEPPTSSQQKRSSSSAQHLSVQTPPMLTSVHVSSAATKSLYSSSSSSSSSPTWCLPNEPAGDQSLNTSSTTNCLHNYVLPKNMSCQQEVRALDSGDHLLSVVGGSNTHKQSASTTRSILKAPRIYRERGRLFTDNFANIIVNECRTSSGSSTQRTVTGADLLTVSRVTKDATVMPGGGSDSGSKDKGRLVRFSADDQIHEFTSLEPVASNDVI